MSNPVIHHNNFNFAKVKTYSFYTSDSVFYDSQNLSHSRRSSIELAIEKNLDTQSFKYSELDEADIIVTYHIVNKRPQEYQDYNKAVRFCSHCLKANAWQQNDNDWKVYPGGLIIDLIDPKRNRSVWRSIYPLKFTAKDNSKTQNEIIIEAVNTMLFHYPTKQK